MGIFKKRSDEEYVDQVRKSVASFDRWRPWMKGLYVIELVVYLCGIAAIAIALESKMFNEIPHRWLGFSLGVVLGGLFGAYGQHILQGVFSTWKLGFRNERLLVRYHDELVAIQTATKNHMPDSSH